MSRYQEGEEKERGGRGRKRERGGEGGGEGGREREREGGRKFAPLVIAYVCEGISFLTIQCIIYKLIKYPQLKDLLQNEQVRSALEALSQLDYSDRDILFDEARNCDYSHISRGIVKEQFIHHFHPFIRVCVEQQHIDVSQR